MIATSVPAAWAQNIPKRLVFCTAILLSGSARAVPVAIAWQVPLTGTDRYVLEVASDANFGTIVLTTEVQGKNFDWETPGEGVFHWRLSRPGKETGNEPADQEGSTFVSGSFVAVDSTVTRERPPKLSWDPIDGADFYKLYVLDAQRQVRTMTTTSTSFIVPTSDQALMIELVPYSGSRKTFRNYHYNPSLKFDAGLPPVVAAVAAAPAAAEVPPEIPVPVEPVPVAPEEPTALRRRVHQVVLLGAYTDEKMRLQKLAIDLDARTPVAGAGARVWSNPVAGLVVEAGGRYHEHKADVEQPAIAPGETTEFDEARYDLSIDVGWDLLHGFDVPAHMLVLALHGTAMQVPMLPLEVSNRNTPLPSPEKRALSLIGGSLGYSFHYGYGAVTVDGGLAVEAEEDGNVAFQRLTFDFYATERLVIQLAGFHQLLEVTRCHKESSTCLIEGRSLTTLESFGATLGLGGVFR